MSIDLAALEALARKASPGPWHSHVADKGSLDAAIARVAESLRFSESGELAWVRDDDKEVALIGNGPHRIANSEYLAALDPQTILALIERAKADRGDLEWAMHHMTLTYQPVLGDPGYARMVRIRSRLSEGGQNG